MCILNSVNKLFLEPVKYYKFYTAKKIYFSLLFSGSTVYKVKLLQVLFLKYKSLLLYLLKII